jgi:hypothetical protein
MKNTRKFFFVLIGLVIASFFVFGDTSILKAQSTVLEMDGFAWSNTNDAGVNGAGWIHFKDQLTDPASWQVTIDATGNLTGYAWANPVDTVTGEKNFGWVKFGGLSGFPTGSGTTATNARLVGNNIIGWARFCSATENTMGTNVPGNCSSMNDNINGGWDGWISFAGDATSGGIDSGSYAVTVGPVNSQGQRFLSGFAWGGPLNVGWIDMSQVFIDGNAGGKSLVTFTATTTSGSVTANQQTPSVSTSSTSSNNNVVLSWNVLDVAPNSCKASGDWLSGNPGRSSTNGGHAWPALTFLNTTSSAITKSFTITCQGDENGNGNIGPIVRNILVTILPGGKVASVVVTANPKNVPDVNGFFLTDITWTTNAIIPNTCVGMTTFNGVVYTNPKWTTPLAQPLPYIFLGTSGVINDVLVPGSAVGDATIFKLTCTRGAGTTGASCGTSPNLVCGQDTVVVNENVSLVLTAHKDPYVSGSQSISQVNPGEKISLRWESVLNKDLECSAIGMGGVSSPNGAWFGPKADLLAGNSFTAIENGVSVIPATTTYTLTCRDKVTLQTYVASTQVSVAGLNGLQLSLSATDEYDNNHTVEVGGTVKIDIKKTAGDFNPGTCDVTSSPTTAWSAMNSATYDPDGSFVGIDIGGANVGDIVYYNITCEDKLNNTHIPIVTDSITVVPRASANVHLDLNTNTACIEPGDSLTLTVISASAQSNPFTSCTTGYSYVPGGGVPAPVGWNNFGSMFWFNQLNNNGTTDFGPFIPSGVADGGTLNYSISCVDGVGDSVSSQVSVNVATDCNFTPPGGGGGNGNIKPIIEER